MALALVTSGQIIGSVGLTLVALVLALVYLANVQGTLTLAFVLLIAGICIVYCACENVEIPKS